MSTVNKRIFEEIENSDFPSDIKSFLKTLLFIELRGARVYSQDYDREILKHVEMREKGEDSRSK